MAAHSEREAGGQGGGGRRGAPRAVFGAQGGQKPFARDKRRQGGSRSGGDAGPEASQTKAKGNRRAAVQAA